MPHKIRNAFDKHLTFESLLSAHARASKTKRNSKEVLIFEIDLETNLVNLYKQLKNGTYKMGKYREFKIYEPKERVIRSLPYIDRMVHQWYIHEFIKPYITPRFIKDSYACIDGRGTHKAVETLQEYMRKMKNKYGSYYILKCDVRRFFYNIDKDVLLAILSKIIKDPKLMELTKVFIYGDLDDVGIPIGNYTSQYFANIYMNELDQYVKQELKVKYYVRYMDDFILLVESKQEAKRLLFLISQFLEENLHLELNHKSGYFPNRAGVDFCGFRIFESYRLLRKRSYKKIKKKVKKWNYLYEHEILDIHQVLLEWNSWIAHSNHASCYALQRKVYDSILCKDELPPPKIENIT